MPGSTSANGAAGPRPFPPEVVVAVKALACELPARLGVPLSRLHIPDIATEVISRGIVAEISGTTVWRWLSDDAIKPWRHRSWIFPGTPISKLKQAGCSTCTRESGEAGRSAKTTTCSLRTKKPRSRLVPAATRASLPPRARRQGRARVRPGWGLAVLCRLGRAPGEDLGRCEAKTGIEPFGRLVGQVMGSEPYLSARRVFWVVDNGSSHRGEAACERLAARWPNAQLVQLPVHASWLNQVEIYNSIIQRKVLTPNDFADLAEVEQRLAAFERRYERSAAPFEWKFTRNDLALLMKKLAHKPDYQAFA